uniref:Uncharacterized protein n=1 Tax=Culex tarsalis TaxID=7177 RepID=A0A1Q3F361_CULTA
MLNRIMPKQKWNTGKQYCAEPETDPYDQIYRKSNLFLDYMNESSCKIPRIDEFSADPTTELLETIENIDLPAHRLTGKVRCQYLKYLEGLLQSNYSAWSSSVEPYENVTFSPEEIKRCAERIEMKAVQSCMIVQIYRKFILKTIAQIRKETAECSIHPNLVDSKFAPKIIKKECSHVSVQTDELVLDMGAKPQPASIHDQVGELPDVPAMSLDEKIRNFEAKMHISTRKSKSSRKSTSKKSKKEPKSSTEAKAETSNAPHEPANTGEVFTRPAENVVTACESISKEEDDHIIRELEAMFDNGDEGNIFESCENQVQINAIISEIEKFDPHQVEGRSKPPLSTPSPQLNEPIDAHLLPAEHSPTKEADLKKSLWPCEYHMQKMKLRELLSNIADTNYFKYERIRLRFIELFGEYEEEEDELGPYSPSIELNEVLISSCRQRIAKWVVQSLMKPLNEGLIGNRFLFKKLAKHLADGIIYANQYPNQRFIKNYIVEYFCTHPAIQSVEDMY